VAQLRQAGWRVIAIHRESSSTRRLAELGAELRQAGLDDPSAIAGAMPEGVEAVFHVAGDISWSRLHEERQRRVNVDGTRHVVEAALLRKAQRFIHTSSVAAYGLGHAVIDERTPSTAAGSSAGYVRTKWLGEEEVRKGIQRGLSAVILNPAHIMGPYDTSGWARLFRLLKEGKLPGVPPGGASFCHAREVARAHIEAVTRGRTGEQYLLGGTDATYVEIGALVAGLLGVKAPRPAPAFVLKALGHVNDWMSYVTRKEPAITAANAELVCSHVKVDCSRAEAELGFRRTTPREVVEDSFRWLRQEHLI
jgi:nucleoside-diphosphate-sugar epimerase